MGGCLTFLAFMCGDYDDGYYKLTEDDEELLQRMIACGNVITESEEFITIPQHVSSCVCRRCLRVRQIAA
jgi:hypothetical protein